MRIIMRKFLCPGFLLLTLLVVFSPDKVEAARSIDSAEKVRIVDPGLTMAGSWTWFRVFRFTGDGPNTIIKIGADESTTGANTRGILALVFGDQSVRMESGEGMAVGVDFDDTDWHYVAGSWNGGSNGYLYADGTAQFSSWGTVTEIQAGDSLSIAYGYDAFGWPDFDGESGMVGFLEGVQITDDAVIADYLDDPCSLLADYGPEGSVTPDALKVLLLGNHSVDLAQGLTVSLTGGGEVAGPIGYATACDSTPPIFSAVTPATSTSINSVTTSSDIGFTTDEALMSGSITITRTGGTADGASPHTCTLAGTALNVGAHTINLSDTTNGCTSDVSNLVSGTIYTFVFAGEDAASNEATPITRTSVTFDNTLPIVTNVTSDKANGTYGIGEVIDIDVTFSEAVTSTGNVTVTLETGATDRTCTFTVSGATTGTCNYTVQDGDASSDLTVSSIAGTIADAASNAMTNFMPATNLAANKDMVIDTNLVVRTSSSGFSSAARATQSSPSNAGASTPSTVSITRNLTKGTYGEDVRSLQMYLNQKGFTLALTGPGSPGNETTFFGPLTKAALIKFQLTNNIFPPVGFFGPITRGFVQSRP